LELTPVTSPVLLAEARVVVEELARRKEVKEGEDLEPVRKVGNGVYLVQ